MPENVYNHIIKNFEAEDVQIVLKDSMADNEIINFARKAGLSYNGMRIKSMPLTKLIVDLSQEFFADTKNAIPIIRSLEKNNLQFIDTLKKINQDQAEDFLNENFNHFYQNNQIGNILWAFMIDPRAQVSQLTSTLKKLYHEKNGNGKKDIKNIESLQDKELTSANNSQFAQKIEKLNETIEMLENVNAKQLKRYNELLQKYDGLKARVKKLNAEKTDLKHQKYNDEKELHLYQVMIKNLEKKIAEHSDDQEKFRLQEAHIHHLDRENRKLRHQLESLQVQIFDKSNQSVSLIATLKEEVETIRDELRFHHRSTNHHEEKLLKTISEVQNNSACMKRNLEKLQDLGVSYGKRPHDDSTRVAVFVDVQNMFYAAKKQFNARLDYEKLLEASVGNRRLIQATSYVVQTPDVDQSNFVAMLQHKNYIVKMKDLRQRADGSAKGDWDMGMAIDMISVADKVDVIVLVSGDGDFVSLVNLIKAKGPKVEVFGFPHNTAIDLKEAADDFFPIRENLLLMMPYYNHNNNGHTNESIEDNSPVSVE